jgi:hypothetical protein
VFFVAGVMPDSKVAALNAVHIGDVVASVDGRVVSSSFRVEEVARMMDESRGMDADILLFREVPGSGLVQVNLRFTRTWREEQGHFDDGEHDELAMEEGAMMKSSPRSFDSTSSSLVSSRASPICRRYRSFDALGSFDTQISSPQQSPRGERRGTQVFNEVSEFGTDCDQMIMHQTAVHSHTPCGVGLILRNLLLGDRQLFLVDGVVPGSAADASRRIMVGDALLAVDGCSVDQFSSIDEVVENIIGPTGTNVILLLHRALTDSTYTVTLARRVPKAASVDKSNSRSSSRSNSINSIGRNSQGFI